MRYRALTDLYAADLDIDTDRLAGALVSLHNTPAALRDGRLSPPTLQRAVDDLDGAIVALDRPDQPPLPLSVGLRVAHRDEGHTHFDVFVAVADDHGRMPNRSNAGRLILRTREFDALVDLLRATGTVVEVDYVGRVLTDNGDAGAQVE